MKNVVSLFLVISAVISIESVAQPVYQFRGPDRNGIYPEKNLLEYWPEDGPTLLWKSDSIGNGFSSPVATPGMVYVSGEIDSVGYLFAFNRKGELVWKKETGAEWVENFPGPRSSVTVSGDLLYCISSMGRLLCLSASDGSTKWSLDMISDLHGMNVRFGFSESVLLDHDRLYCSPGGTDTNFVALDRFTGRMIWKSKLLGDTVGYCSPVIADHNGRKILFTLVIHHLEAIDAQTGALLWSQKFDRPSDIHCNAPWYEQGDLYINDRGGNGIVKLQISSDGKSYTEAWRNFKGGNVQSGFIKLGGYLYGSRYRPARFESVDAATGNVTDSLKFAVASTIFADNHFYCYGEDGTMGLIRPDTGKLTLVSKFKIREGSKEHFAHPAINDGVLYVRHGNILLAYDIRRKE